MSQKDEIKESSWFQISYVMLGEDLCGRFDDVTTELSRAYLTLARNRSGWTRSVLLLLFVRLLCPLLGVNGRLWRNYSPREQFNATNVSRTLLTAHKECWKIRSRSRAIALCRRSGVLTGTMPRRNGRGIRTQILYAAGSQNSGFTVAVSCVVLETHDNSDLGGGLGGRPYSLKKWLF